MITYLRYGSFAASMTGNVIFAGRQFALLEGEDFRGPHRVKPSIETQT